MFHKFISTIPCFKLKTYFSNFVSLHSTSFLRSRASRVLGIGNGKMPFAFKTLILLDAHCNGKKNFICLPTQEIEMLSVGGIKRKLKV